MSDISSYSNINTDELYLQAVEDYLGDTMSLEDFYKMSSEERQAYFFSKIEEKNLPSDTYEKFIDALETELDDWDTYLYDQYSQLDAILSSDNPILASDAASISYLMEELKAIREMCGNDLLDDAEAAEDIFNEHNVTAEDNDYVTHSPDNPQDGDVYNIDCTNDDGSNEFTSALSVDDENGALYDVDKDGVIEAGEYWDANGDGISDYDIDGDGDIDELDDPTRTDGTNGTSFVPSIPDGAEVYVMGFDDSGDPVTMRLKITLEDGTIYYYNVTGNPKIICDVPVNYQSLPDSLAGRWYEQSSSEFPISHWTTGYDPTHTGSVYTNVDMNNEVINNSYTIDPTTEDFENERVYTITFDANAADSLNIDANGNAVTFETDAEGNLVVVLTNADGKEIRIVCKGIEYDSGQLVSDTINITNGEIDYDACQDFFNTFTDIPDHSSTITRGSLYYMITVDGESLASIYTSLGKMPTLFGFIMPGETSYRVTSLSRDDGEEPVNKDPEGGESGGPPSSQGS